MYLPVSITGFSVVGISMVISGYTNLEINFNYNIDEIILENKVINYLLMKDVYY